MLQLTMKELIQINLIAINRCNFDIINNINSAVTVANLQEFRKQLIDENKKLQKTIFKSKMERIIEKDKSQGFIHLPASLL